MTDLIRVKQKQSIIAVVVIAVAVAVAVVVGVGVGVVVVVAVARIIRTCAPLSLRPNSADGPEKPQLPPSARGPTGAGWPNDKMH